MKLVSQTVVFLSAVSAAGLTYAEVKDEFPLDGRSTAAIAINALGLDLLRAKTQADGNAVLSPYSIQVGLAMTYAGAVGKTRDEMTKALHYPAKEERLHASLVELTAALEKVARSSAGRTQRINDRSRRTGDPIALSVANRLFGQMGLPFRWPFLKFLDDSYRAPLSIVDFKNRYEAIRGEINAWVAEQTRQRVRTLLPPNALDSLTRLVLVNAIYFRAPWKDKFDKSSTKRLPFSVKGGGPAEVETMIVTSSLGYGSYQGFTVLTVPYSNPEIQFLILLPNKGANLGALEAKLTPDQLGRLAQVPTTRVRLYMPKFKIEPPTIHLSQILSELGMKSAFIPGIADFRGIDSARDLFVKEVFHKAFLGVDEQGTGAAAASAVVLNWLAREMTDAPKEIHVDRPFLFAVQHRRSGACLFMGRVTDPR